MQYSWVVIIDSVGSYACFLSSTVLLIGVVQLLSPRLFHLLIRNTKIFQHSICRRICRTSADLEDTFTGNKCHTESSASAFLHIKLGWNVIIIVLACVHARLQTHDVVERVFVSRVDERAAICHIRHFQECLRLRSWDHLISCSISEHVAAAKSSAYRRSLQNSFLLVSIRKLLGICVVEVLHLQYIFIVVQRESLLNSIFDTFKD